MEKKKAFKGDSHRCKICAAYNEQNEQRIIENKTYIMKIFFISIV
jgi:hypothetical protein